VVATISKEPGHIHALSLLTLNAGASEEAYRHVATLSTTERDEFLSLADSHHVIVRALQALAPAAAAAGKAELGDWIANTLVSERARITNALQHLRRICDGLEAAACPVAVMKTLEHWPDLGNDLDLYTTADEQKVVRVFQEQFGAKLEPRSWGDRLANKWNFALPGLPELVEVHAKRLGQTGEHTALARRFIGRRMPREVGGYTFLVPAPEECVIVATLQRMYRHFYFRVCDIVNTAASVEAMEINYQELRRASDMGGIWPGVATYLKIVSDYVARYRGAGLPLPAQVVAAARFGGEKVQVRGRFIRVPLMPQGADLYTRQVTSTALRGDVPATLRLSLLPYLASAAAVSLKLTGSDKGIW
jgi:hypothetical protein